MTIEESTKMCPIWQHECYNEKCQAWINDRCEILFVMSLPNTSWVIPVSPDPTKLKFWESPFTCSGSERITW